MFQWNSLAFDVGGFFVLVLVYGGVVLFKRTTTTRTMVVRL